MWTCCQSGDHVNRRLQLVEWTVSTWQQGLDPMSWSAFNATSPWEPCDEPLQLGPFHVSQGAAKEAYTDADAAEHEWKRVCRESAIMARSSGEEDKDANGTGEHGDPCAQMSPWAFLQPGECARVSTTCRRLWSNVAEWTPIGDWREMLQREETERHNEEQAASMGA